MPVRSLRFVLAGVLALLVLPARAQTPQTVLFPGTTGTALLDTLARTYTPDRTLGYGPARDVLYGAIDLQPGRQLRGVYTGYTITLDEGVDPSIDAYEKGINAEHTWPQSLGAREEPARSDMHHLFPTLVEANAERGSNPFADIPDDRTDTWWYLDQQTRSIPSSDIDLYSESTGDLFEPRDQHKGNVARAMFYFYTVYRPDSTFLEQQAETLRRWHYVVDPVDQAESDRSQAIAARQGNANPFVLDSTLVRRAFFSNDDDGGGGTDTTSLGPGALVVVGFNSDQPRTFAFVPLVNLPAGTELLFTDNGVRSDGSFRANEGTLRYTAGTLVEAGTVVVYDESSDHPFEVVEGSFATSTGGDQIVAYRESEDERTFLYAVDFSAGTWQDDATDSNTSALPPGLEEGVTAVALGDADNGVYTGPTDVVPTEMRRRVSDAANWQLSDTDRQAMPSQSWPLPHEATHVPQHRQPMTLSAPAPHPFYDRTTVRLLVPQPRPVRVELFDALGRCVRVLYEGMPSGSTLQLTVDGTGLPPGLYLLRATGAGTSVTRRLVRL